jgi:hypothetical protein
MDHKPLSIVEIYSECICTLGQLHFTGGASDISALMRTLPKDLTLVTEFFRTRRIEEFACMTERAHIFSPHRNC